MLDATATQTNDLQFDEVFQIETAANFGKLVCETTVPTIALLGGAEHPENYHQSALALRGETAEWIKMVYLNVGGFVETRSNVSAGKKENETDLSSDSPELDSILQEMVQVSGSILLIQNMKIKFSYAGLSDKTMDSALKEAFEKYDEVAVAA